MDGNELSEKVGLEQKNQFIFSDSYYDELPEIPTKHTFESVKPYQKEESSTNLNVGLNQSNSTSFPNNDNGLFSVTNNNSNVQQVNNFEQLVQNDYDNNQGSSENVFNFFAHQANTNIVEPVQEQQPIVDSYNNQETPEKENSNFFDIFSKRNDKPKELEKVTVGTEIINPNNNVSNPEYNDFSIGNVVPTSENINSNSSVENDLVASPVTEMNNTISNEMVDLKQVDTPSMNLDFVANPTIASENLKQEMDTVDFIQRLKDQDDINSLDVPSAQSSPSDSVFSAPFGTVEEEEKTDFLLESKPDVSEEEIVIPERKMEYGNYSNQQLGPEPAKFIVTDDPNVEVNQAKKEFDASKIPDFMSGTIHASDFDIESGINTELEAELLRQRNEDEAKKILENPEFAAYQRYTKEDPTKEMVYKASGKSYIRDVVKKPKPVPRPVYNPIVETPLLENDESDTIQTTEVSNEPRSIEDMIESIVGVPGYEDIEVKLDPYENPGVRFGYMEKEEPKVVEEDQPTTVYDEKKDNFDYDQNFENVEVVKSDLLEQLSKQAKEEGKISILARYGEDFCAKDFITNPAIGRAEEIKQLILILLTPEKSGILVGKPGIGKTSIVEGLAYQLQRNNVPDALKGYRIVNVKTASLLGTLPTGETRLQTLVDELKQLEKIILFIDEIHMLIGATNDSAMDFANMFKESLGRGSIKVIGATTTEEYERYVLRDKAFVRRFQKVEVEEPNREHTIKILMGTLPKIEKNTGAKMKYSEFMKTEIMGFIVDITTEYKRIYGIGSRYPDICLTLLSQAFSQAVFANRKEVNIMDIRKAIENSTNIYPDVIRKELVNFDVKFKDLIREEELSN